MTRIPTIGDEIVRGDTECPDVSRKINRRAARRVLGDPTGDRGITRPSATKYLSDLATAGFVRKVKLGRSNFYINEPLFKLLAS